MKSASGIPVVRCGARVLNFSSLVRGRAVGVLLFAVSSSCSGKPGQSFEESWDNSPVEAVQSNESTVLAMDEPLPERSTMGPPSVEQPSAKSDQGEERSRQLTERNAILNEPIEGPLGPPCDAVEKVFRVSCGGDCHVGVGIGNFAVGEKEARSYVGILPNINSSSCGQMINPDRPLESLILTKVTGDYPFDEGDCRTLMPPPFGGLTNEQIECLESWLWQFRRQD